MQTSARKRAEALFAEFTHLVDDVAKSTESTEPMDVRPAPRASGPKTLHLPSDGQPVQTGWRTAKSRRDAKTASPVTAS